ncbi:carbamoyltransferase HypF [Desertibaculum subflavum]|uniref:carbamoyltransferase HypF n=1 Tax=Desertibaculum subflavum TaxID=2268458 RepID=UPI000E672E11
MPDRQRMHIEVRGTVQGVGFRPFVYRHATALDLAGWVGNSPQGLTVEAEGPPDRLAALISAIRKAPAHAAVASLHQIELPPQRERGFAIRDSLVAGPPSAEVLPDLATCADCLAEMRDPANRRYRYPFINCTECGPRYSILEALPYDRVRTSMRAFPMCVACSAEYGDPRDRRFHAEPNACPACGPKVALWDAEGRVLESGDMALRAAAVAIRTGRVVAVKGIGGFHLVVDARNQDAVARLRAAKRRPEKPFAVMFPHMPALRAACRVGAAEEALLIGPARPIVLLRRNASPGEDSIAPAVAPGSARLGAFLPYAPPHHLLLDEVGFPVVATSGNSADEPIVTDEQEALARLCGIADLLLVHDRGIVRPIDDSIAQVVCGEAQLLRRARGYAPAPVRVADVGAGVMAVGAHLKATVALTRGNDVILSQHIGDLDTLAAREAHARCVDDLARLHDAVPRLAASDLHPDYASTSEATDTDLPVVAVQHHVAHVAACLAENGVRPPALGIAFDGSGYGLDRTIWGGEFLRVDRGRWHRAAHLRQFSLPGGEAAVREPRRAALGLLFAAFGEAAFDMTELAPVAAFSEAGRRVLRRMLIQGVNAPVCSSVGRLFDAFASLCGLCQRASYEGQAAAAFEWVAETDRGARIYALPVREAAGRPLIVDWEPALRMAISDLHTGVPAGAISAALHRGLAAAIAAVAMRLDADHVALTGGCFQNVRLTEAAVAALRAAGREPLWHRRVPPNDGGIALGQAVWAAWQEGRS